MAGFTERVLNFPKGFGSWSVPQAASAFTLPMDNVRSGIIEAAVGTRLDRGPCRPTAAEAIMTSDTRPKANRRRDQTRAARRGAHWRHLQKARA